MRRRLDVEEEVINGVARLEALLKEACERLDAAAREFARLRINLLRLEARRSGLRPEA